MTKLIATLVVSGTLVVLVLPAMVQAQDEEWVTTPESGDGASGQTARPPTPPPSESPPAPPSENPPAPQAQAQAPSSVPPGQWVYTEQYGWIWMPYADAYTY